MLESSNGNGNGKAKALEVICPHCEKPFISNSVVELTWRQRGVLGLMADGLKTSEIAKILGLSVKTVETHRHQIMKRLGLYSLADLVKYAIKEGLTSPDPRKEHRLERL